MEAKKSSTFAPSKNGDVLRKAVKGEKNFFCEVLQGRKKVVPLQPQNGRKFFEKDERKRSGTLKPKERWKEDGKRAKGTNDYNGEFDPGSG
ncbi:MAG: hypothetical protein WHT22_09680, partial [Bacteroidales bacterium]